MTKKLTNFYREDIPKLLEEKKNLIGVELGVAQGNYAKKLINYKNFDFFYGVDNFSFSTHDTNEYILALKEIGLKENYKILRMNFKEALKVFPDNSIDFIYFDGFAHTGQNYGETIYEWYKKMKPNSIMSGDDYDPKWKLNKFIIDEFSKKNNFDLLITDTRENHKFSSWIIKITNKKELIKVDYPKYYKYLEILKSYKLYLNCLNKIFSKK